MKRIFKELPSALALLATGIAIGSILGSSSPVVWYAIPGLFVLGLIVMLLQLGLAARKTASSPRA